MLESLKKGLYTGIGIALRSSESIKSWAQKTAAENNLSQEEGKKFVDEILKESEDAATKLQTKVKEEIDKAAREAGFVRKSDWDALVKRLEALEKKSSESAGS